MYNEYYVKKPPFYLYINNRYTSVWKIRGKDGEIVIRFIKYIFGLLEMIEPRLKLQKAGVCPVYFGLK